MIVYTQDDGTVAVCSFASSVPDGVSFIETGAVPDRKHRSAWRVSGDSVVTDAVEELAINRQEKVDQIKAEMMSRVSTADPEIENFDDLKLLKKLWPSLDTAQLPAGTLLAKDIGVYGFGKVTFAKVADQSQLDGYDPVGDVGWPG